MGKRKVHDMDELFAKSSTAATDKTIWQETEPVIKHEAREEQRFLTSFKIARAEHSVSVLNREGT